MVIVIFIFSMTIIVTIADFEKCGAASIPDPGASLFL